MKLDNDNKPINTYLGDEDLKRELSEYGEKNNIPKKIIEKTYDKLKRKNIQITNDQLKLLISRIAKEMQNINHMNEKDSMKTDNAAIDKGDSSENNILEVLKNIENRILKLEKHYSEISNYPDNIINPNQENNMSVSANNKNIDKVKLNEIPLDAQSTVILMKWLQYLIDKLGKSQASDVLNFYADVGWITEDIKYDLLKYIKGITDEKSQEGKEKNRKITSKEHIHSLLFIQKLKGKNIDDFLWKVDQDLEKFFKNIEDHYSSNI
jgi:flagellar protein FlaD